MAEYMIYLVALVAALTWWRLSGPDRVSLGIQAAAAALITLVLVQVANHLYYDPRPFASGHVHAYFSHPADNGFPSDHTAVAAMAAFLLWPYRRIVAAVLAGAAVLLGAARVLAHVHSPIDILAALVIAGLGAALGHYTGMLAYQRWRTRRARG